MLTPILTTKLYRPQLRPDLIARRRLLRLLDEAAQGPLTVLSAPAGFGKSMLLAAWLAELSRPAAWLALDESDNDPAHFWRYVVAALRTFHPAIGADLLVLIQSSEAQAGRLPLEAMLATLLNDLAASPIPLVFVLDDYHLVDNRAVHQALTYFIEHLPSQLHLVIATRVDPPLPLARWRARGQLGEVRAADLRFTEEETARFLAGVVGATLPRAASAALAQRTEGWIAGLQLAALSMQGRSDLADFVAAFAGSHRYIMDFLAEEVLQRQPAEIQQFLLQTSILDRLCAPLCDAVLGNSPHAAISGLASLPTGSQTLLEHLLRANLFIIALDDERHWFRYHHLFADVLRQRLTSAQAETLHRRASAWYAGQDLAADAIYHALAAHDFDAAARLIERNGLVVVQRGEVVTVQGWLRALPLSVRTTRPGLTLVAAFAALGIGHAAEAERWLNEAEQQLASAAEADAHTAAEVAGARAMLATFHQHHPRAIAFATQALADLPAKNYQLRAAVAAGLGFAQLLAGNLPAAERTLLDALAGLPDESSLLIPHMVMVSTLGLVRATQGRRRAALDLQRQALALVERQGRTLPLAATVLVIHELGRLHYDQNLLDEAEQYLQQTLAVGGPANQSAQVGFATRLLALVAQARGEFDRALALVSEAEAIVRLYPVNYVEAATEPVRVHIWLRQGNLAAAVAWADEQSLAEIDARPLHPFDWTRFVLAEVWLAQGKLQQSHEMLAAVRNRAEAARMGHFVLWALTLQALGRHLAGERSAAWTLLERALALAAPEAYIRLFVDLGDPMRRLLTGWLSNLRGVGALAPDLARLRDFAEQLLQAFAQDGDSLAAHAGQQSPARVSTLIEPLSERELEVLRSMAGGLSNQQIADQLVVTVGTIKKHLANVYGKLGVDSRTQALVRAQALGLL